MIYCKVICIDFVAFFSKITNSAFVISLQLIIFTDCSNWKVFSIKGGMNSSLVVLRMNLTSYVSSYFVRTRNLFLFLWCLFLTGEALRPSLQQLCANVLGYLNTKGLYPSLKVLDSKENWSALTVVTLRGFHNY